MRTARPGRRPLRCRRAGRPVRVYSPMIRISCSSVTPKWPRTRSCVSSISPSMSAAVAPPRLTMKLACLAEISAPLTRLPLSPTFSIMRPATSPGGFFQTQPAEARARGCVAFFCLSRTLMSRWMSAKGRRPRLLAVDLRAPQAAFELEGDAAHAAVADEQVVAAADDDDGQLLAVRKEQRMADVVHVLRHDEDVRGPADAQRSVEAERFLEPHFPSDFP